MKYKKQNIKPTNEKRTQIKERLNLNVQIPVKVSKSKANDFNNYDVH